MAERRHHSIGEVLSLLKQEHDDVTISKIRFFESQGLIDPERTPSGYRRFYDDDIERLRWILTQQRDHFLPLKVIKRRLEEAGFDPTVELNASEVPLPEPTLFASRDRDEDPDVDAETGADPTVAVDKGDDPDMAPDSRPEPDLEFRTVPDAPPVVEGDPLDTPAASVSMTAIELAEAAGTDRAFVDELDRLGLVTSVADAYDHEALVVAKAAAVFRGRGVEPRHLRMFKVAADREAGVLEQLVGPKLLKGGELGQQGRAELNEMVRLGETIQRSILRRSFGSHLD